MYTTLAFPILLATTAQAASSTGCGQLLSKDLTKGQKGNSNSLTFNTSDGTERSYLLHIPDGYDVNTPTGLIWSYHGRGKNAERQEEITKFSSSESTPNYIVVYPQGTSKNAGKSRNVRRHAADDYDDEYDDEGEYDEEPEEDGSDEYGDDDQGDVSPSSSGGKGGGKGSGGKKGAWQGDPAVKTDDVKFTLELLDNITKTFCNDEDRVYASGISNGGGFVANILACDATASTKFAAFASASGAYYQDGSKDKCDGKTVPIVCNNNGAKIPLIATAGGKDKVIPYDGGSRRKSCLPSVEHFMTAAAQRNGLDKASTQSRFNDSEVVHYSYGRDAGLGMVQYYYVPDMGHTWPAGDAKTHVSATKVFMEFFDQWNLTARAAAASSLPSATAASSMAGGRLLIPVCQMLGLVVSILGVLHFV
jgi:poly(3-hydroxybutyrate) depolymerase